MWEIQGRREDEWTRSGEVPSRRLGVDMVRARAVRSPGKMYVGPGRPTRFGTRRARVGPLPTRAFGVLSLLHDRFHWPGMFRDAKAYVLSCGCRRRKRSRSQRIAMLPARYLEPWEVLEVDLKVTPNTSEAGNEYLRLVVDKASRFCSRTLYHRRRRMMWLVCSLACV